MNAGQGPAFAESIQICFNKYVDFQGRASRAEFWWWVLFVFLVSLGLQIVAGIVDVIAGTHVLGYLVRVVVTLGFLLPNLAVAVRRLHDLDKPGWWIGALYGLLFFTLILRVIPFLKLLTFIPALAMLVLAVVLIFWFCQRGTSGNNQFGADPLMSSF